MKVKLWTLTQQIAELQHKQTELQDKNQEGGPEERDRLLRQVKEENQEIANMERRIAETEDIVRRLQQQLDQSNVFTAGEGNSYKLINIMLICFIS
jgi:intraflagellar transport protein 74